MYCLKCGKETQGNQVFCEGCLDGMDHYPVKPGTPIQLPRGPEQSAPKKTPPRKRPPTAEEQLASLRKSNRRLRRFALILLLALLVCGGILAYRLLQPEPAALPSAPIPTQIHHFIP